jgi:phage terminase large subunit-like protein
VLIDDALQGNDPKVVVSLYTADMEIDPFSVKAMKQANPAYGDFLNAELVRGMAEDARRMPARESQYRNLVLNQRVEATTPFVSRSLWMSCGDEPAEFDEDTPIYAGLDLSSVNDLTAFVPIGKVDGIWNVRPTFWLPREGSRTRPRRTACPTTSGSRPGSCRPRRARASTMNSWRCSSGTSASRTTCARSPSTAGISGT